MENFEAMQFNDCQEDELLQLAENTGVDQDQKEPVENEFVEKRNLLQKTKIVRQTWSIAEIIKKSETEGSSLTQTISVEQFGAMTRKQPLSNLFIWRL